MIKNSRKILKMFILLAALVLTSFSIASAAVETTTEYMGDLTLHRSFPKTAFVGQEIWIVMQIENVGAKELTFVFEEKLGDVDFDKNQAKSIEVSDPGPGGVPAIEGGERLELWYYEWEIELPPGENATLAYWLIPKVPGTYVISPAMITVEGEEFYTKSRTIQVKCVSDTQCDVNAGETFLTCPEDCFTGNADGICDEASDGRIDPDCEEGYDPDAGVAIPTATVVPVEEPPRIDLTPYFVMIGALLIIAAVVVIVVVLIIRERRRDKVSNRTE